MVFKQVSLEKGRPCLFQDMYQCLETLLVSQQGWGCCWCGRQEPEMRLRSLMDKQRIAFFKMQQSQRPKWASFLPSHVYLPFSVPPPLPFASPTFSSPLTLRHTPHTSFQLQFLHMLLEQNLQYRVLYFCFFIIQYYFKTKF